MSTRDWNAIRAEYVAGEISLRDLAHKYDMPESNVMDRAAEDGWVAEREQFRSKLLADTLEQARAKRVGERVNAIEVLEDIVLKFQRDLEKKNIAAFDAVNALRFLTVLKGGASDRTVQITQSLDDEARDAGLSEGEIAEIERILREAEKKEPPVV